MSLGAQGIWTATGGNYKWNRGKFDSVLIVPRDTLPTNRALVTSTGFPVGDSGRIAYKNNVFYGRNLTSWQPFALGDLSLYYTKTQSDTTFRNYVQAKRYGAKGDGTLNDSTALKHASDSNNSVFLNKGDYLVSGLYNPHGATWFGDGRIVKNVTGGTQQLNTYADRDKYIFGREYLAYVQNQLISRPDATQQIKVIWSGDSTTEGDGIVGNSPYNINNLFGYMSASYGIGNVLSLNRGHSGETTVDWESTYLASDLAESPDLYIIRWGINDGVGGDVDAFITALRNGLTTLRAARTVGQMSIILMSPNSTSDTPNGRDEKWYEQINQAIKQAARDFQCTFIDTYAMWKDSRPAANVWMDNPYGDGRAIHPLDVMNEWIVSTVTDVVYPSVLLRKEQTSKIQNYVSQDRLVNDTTSLPLYDFGLTMERAYKVTKTWPLDGQTTTFKSADGVGFQLNTGYIEADSGKVFFRSTAVSPLSPHPINAKWTGWRRIAMFQDMNLQQVATTGNVYTGQLVANSYKTKTALNNNSFLYNNELDVSRWGIGFVDDYDMGFAAYNDAGSYIGTRLFIRRQSSEVGVNTSLPTSTMHVGGSFATAITTVTGTTSVNANHHTVRVNNSSDVAINLPAASTCPGRIFIIKKVSNNAFTVTITGSGAETIDGSNTNVISAFNASVMIQCDGTTWSVL